MVINMCEINVAIINMEKSKSQQRLTGKWGILNLSNVVVNGCVLT